MEKIKALLYSETRPSQKQEARFSAFLRKKYGKGVKLEWIESDLFPGGFRLEVGSDVYDWSVGGRFEQLKRRIDRINGAGADVIPLIREAVEKWAPEALAEETGKVLSVGDGIVNADGLAHATYGEIDRKSVV